MEEKGLLCVQASLGRYLVSLSLSVSVSLSLAHVLLHLKYNSKDSYTSRKWQQKKIGALSV